MEINRSFFICFFLIAVVATEHVPASMQAQKKSLPRLIGCYSRELITFRCHWDVGSFSNLTEPGSLGLFYILKDPNNKNWHECPSYSTTMKNECFFDGNHTSIWVHYAIQLRSRNNDVYDEMFFSVEEIVFPDPPEVLNWTLLSLGPTGLYCDVIVSWDTPPSAEGSVKMGWMTLWYETQYRETGSELWKSLDYGKDTQVYIYGLRSNTEYEVRVRSKMRGYSFGDFGDSIFILVSSKGSRIPITAVCILMATTIGIMLILIVLSRKQKFMVILLPPVPGPKIKGIDPVLLQKGQLTEFTSVLGAHPDLRPELYSNDPWVEFIQVDIDEPIEQMECLDTPLIFSEPCVSDSPPTSSGFQDDDSGRSSCCDPDLSDHDHHDVHQPSTSGQGFLPLIPPANLGALQPVVPPAPEPAWQNSIYSQVAEVMPCGETLLYPEQNVTECSIQGKAKEKNPWMMVTLNEGGYSVNEPMSSAVNSGSESNNTPIRCQDSTAKPDTPIVSPFPILTMPTPPEYTMVDGVGWKDSLLLKTSSAADSTRTLPKSGPIIEGYLTPDLLHSITLIK